MVMALATQNYGIRNLFKPPGPTSDVTVESITKSVLGLESTNGLIPQFLPPTSNIDVPTFRAGDPSNTPLFGYQPLTIGRLGIFAVGKAGYERTVIVLLPERGVPKNVILGVSHQFSQSRSHYQSLGWSNPRSPALVNFVLLKHIINRWGPQVLMAPEPTALVHIVRAGNGSHELGPFQNDGRFVKEALEGLAAATNNAFRVSAVQAFTFSNGIFDFNDFLAGIGSTLDVTRVINMDPRYAFHAKRPNPGTILKQYLSGETYPSGGPVPGFEFMPFERWKNERSYELAKFLPSKFQYLHNHAIPLYALALGLQT